MAVCNLWDIHQRFVQQGNLCVIHPTDRRTGIDMLACLLSYGAAGTAAAVCYVCRVEKQEGHGDSVFLPESDRRKNVHAMHIITAVDLKVEINTDYPGWTLYRHEER